MKGSLNSSALEGGSRMETSATATDRRGAAAWLDRAALLVSFGACPPLLSIAAVWVQYSADPTARSPSWVGWFTLLAVGVPILLLARAVGRGDVRDWEVVQLHERVQPFLHTLGGALAATAVFALGAAPVDLMQFALAFSTLTALLLCVSFFWKISVHGATAGFAAAVLWSVTGLLPVSAGLVLAMIWSRVHLGRHTLAQALAGTALGISVHFVFQLFLP